MSSTLDTIMEGSEDGTLAIHRIWVPTDGNNSEDEDPSLHHDSIPQITQFVPRSKRTHFSELFTPSAKANSKPFVRFHGRENDKEILIFTAGTSVVDSDGWTRAGCAVFTTFNEAPIAFRLPTCNLHGNPSQQTNERAALRAVISALQLCLDSEGLIARVVIATDSAYVVMGSTEGLKEWEQYGWSMDDMQPVEYKDLWRMIIKLARMLADEGINLMFWHLSKEQNRVALHAAESKIMEGIRKVQSD